MQLRDLAFAAIAVLSLIGCGSRTASSDASAPATEAAADYQITEPYWIGREPKGIRAATPVVMLQPGHAEAAEGDDDAQSEDAAISDEGYGRPNASGPYPDPKPKNPCA